MTKHDHASVAWVPEPRSRAVPVLDEKIDSRDLFSPTRVITIAHGSQTYPLRLTAQNKLILTTSRVMPVALPSGRRRTRSDPHGCRRRMGEAGGGNAP